MAKKCYDIALVTMKIMVDRFDDWEDRCTCLSGAPVDDTRKVSQVEWDHLDPVLKVFFEGPNREYVGFAWRVMVEILLGDLTPSGRESALAVLATVNHPDCDPPFLTSMNRRYGSEPQG